MTQKTKNNQERHADLFLTSLWPGEAQVWMDTAVRLDYESNLHVKNRGFDLNKQNVAHVCTGLAFELAYKSLIIADSKSIKRTHSIKELHGMLKEETRRIVEGYITEAGSEDSAALLKYLDKTMTHPDRKYWMNNPWKVKRTCASFVRTGIMTIPELASILHKLVNLGEENLEKARKCL